MNDQNLAPADPTHQARLRTHTSRAPASGAWTWLDLALKSFVQHDRPRSSFRLDGVLDLG